MPPKTPYTPEDWRAIRARTRDARKRRAQCRDCSRAAAPLRRFCNVCAAKRAARERARAWLKPIYAARAALRVV